MPTVATRVGPVAYSDDGTGPVVVLLHAALHDRHEVIRVAAIVDEMPLHQRGKDVSTEDREIDSDDREPEQLHVRRFGMGRSGHGDAYDRHHDRLLVSGDDGRDDHPLEEAPA